MLLAGGAVWLGVTVPGYLRAVSRFTARGVELACYEHAILFAAVAAVTAVIAAVIIAATIVTTAMVFWLAAGLWWLCRRVGRPPTTNA